MTLRIRDSAHNKLDRVTAAMFGSDPPKYTYLGKEPGTDVFTRNITRGPRELTPIGTSLHQAYLVQVSQPGTWNDCGRIFAMHQRHNKFRPVDLQSYEVGCFTRAVIVDENVELFLRTQVGGHECLD